MTNEQRKAINRLRRGLDDIWFATLYSQEEMDKDIDKVLSLTKEQQEEIEKKDKIIDKISQNPFNELRVDGIRFCGKDIKQYFERKVEDVKD